MILLTPSGHGGVAVVVACSDAARAALQPCLRAPNGSVLSLQSGAPPRRAVLYWDGAERDDVLVVDRGVFGLEVHLHGSPALLDAFSARFGGLRETPASAAEQLLRRAMSRPQLRLAIEQMAHCRRDYGSWVRGLPADQREREREAFERRSAVALALATPCRIVLVGRQNAGKSTLFNRLLFRERALTGPLPGLTRDPVGEDCCLSDYPYEVVDTAGLGDAAAAVDAAAIARGRAVVGDLRLLVVDASVGPRAEDRELSATSHLVIATKSDLLPAPWPGDVRCDLRVSCADPAAAGDVRQQCGDLLRAHRGLPVAGRVGGVAGLSPSEMALLRSVFG